MGVQQRRCRQQLLGKVGAGLRLRFGGFGRRRSICRCGLFGIAGHVVGSACSRCGGGRHQPVAHRTHGVRERTRPARKGQEGQHHDQQQKPERTHLGDDLSVGVEGFYRMRQDGGAGCGTPLQACSDCPTLAKTLE